ncbi:MAG: hypothetical protein EOO43_15600, partial [Flavobacterium sp.]
MKKVLFVSVGEIKSKSIIGGNTDEKIIAGALMEVQELELLPLIGDKLYNDLEEAVRTSIVSSGTTLTADQSVILNDYIKQYLIYGTLVYSVVPLQYKLNDKGLNKSTDSNLISVDSREQDIFKNYYKEKFEGYKRRLIEYFKTDTNSETNT